MEMCDPAKMMVQAAYEANQWTNASLIKMTTIN